MAIPGLTEGQFGKGYHEEASFPDGGGSGVPFGVVIVVLDRDGGLAIVILVSLVRGSS